MGAKRCYACKAVKPLADFCNDRSHKDGRNSICRKCVHTDYRRRVAKRDKHCRDCGKTTSNPKAVRCHKCAARHRARSATGRHIHPSGYAMLTGRWDHPNADKDGKVLEHVAAMSAHIGRPMFPNETIHHLNGQRGDNRIENLELWSNGHPYGQRVSDQIAWAKEILRRYEPQAMTECSWPLTPAEMEMIA